MNIHLFILSAARSSHLKFGFRIRCFSCKPSSLPSAMFRQWALERTAFQEKLETARIIMAMSSETSLIISRNRWNTPALSRLRLWTRRFSRIFSVEATLLGETDFHNVTFLPESTLASILKDGFNGFTIHTLTARCVFETVTVAFGYWLFYWPALILLEFRVTFEHHFKKLFFIPNFGGSLLKSKERKSYKIVDGLWLEPPTANWIHHVTHEHWNESIWRRPCCATTAMDNMCHV